VRVRNKIVVGREKNSEGCGGGFAGTPQHTERIEKRKKKKREERRKKREVLR